jgi:hypothetical protein
MCERSFRTMESFPILVANREELARLEAVAAGM